MSRSDKEQEGVALFGSLPSTSYRLLPASYFLLYP